MNEETTTSESGLDSELDEELSGENESSETASDNTEANEETAADANSSQEMDSSDAITGDDSQSVGTNTETDTSSFGTVGIISLIFSVIFTVLVLVSLWKMLEKLGEKGWKILIPIYNIYILLKVAFGSNSINNLQSKEEFNFDDNIANINKFNNDIPDYDSSMSQSSRFEPNNNFESEINSGITRENNTEVSNGFPGIGQGMNEQPVNNVTEMMPNEVENPGLNPNPGMGPMMNGGQMNSGMPGMMPNEMPSPMPEPNQNNQYNNGPMPMPGTGPNGMTKQCPNCHAPVPLNLVVCPNCGANVGGMN